MTAADLAELDCLVFALVEGVHDHWPRCPRCQAGDLWCPSVCEAIEAVLTWRRARALLTRAEELRRRHDEELAAA